MEAEILSWWGTRGHAARLTRAIKLALDPENRFSPPLVDDDGDGAAPCGLSRSPGSRP